MADYDNPVLRSRGQLGTADGAIDQGLRSFMLGVYNYMVIGLAITGVAAYTLYNIPALFNAVFGSPLAYVVMFAPLAMVLFLSFRIDKLSPGTARALFFVYSALVGLSLAAIFAVYAGADIVRVFFITAAAFASLSLYGYTTNRDLSGMGSFLIMGLFGVIIAMVVNWFLASAALDFAISVIGVLVFAGLTAYDTQRIKEMYFATGGVGEVAAKASIMGALSLYLDFINMFLFLLQMFGSSRE